MTAVAYHGLKRVCLTFAVIVDMLLQELHSFRSIRTQAVATHLGVVINNLLNGANLIWRESKICWLVRGKENFHILQLRLGGKIYTATGIALRHKRLGGRRVFDKAGTLDLVSVTSVRTAVLTRELTKFSFLRN